MVQACGAIELAGQYIAGQAGDVSGGASRGAIAIEIAGKDSADIGADRPALGINGQLPEIVISAGGGIHNDQMAIVGAPATGRGPEAMRRLGNTDPVGV